MEYQELSKWKDETKQFISQRAFSFTEKELQSDDAESILKSLFENGHSPKASSFIFCNELRKV